MDKHTCHIKDFGQACSACIERCLKSLGEPDEADLEEARVSDTEFRQLSLDQQAQVLSDEIDVINSLGDLIIFGEQEASQVAASEGFILLAASTTVVERDSASSGTNENNNKKESKKANKENIPVKEQK